MTTRILGIDAGLTSPGFAVVETTDTNPIGTALLAECFIPTWKLNDKGKKAVAKKTEHDAFRITQTVQRMLALIKMYRPNVIVAELPTGGAKSGAAIRGMAFSTAMTVATIEAALSYDEHKIIKTVSYITPIENKKGSTGKLTWDIDIDQGKWEVFSAVAAIWPGVTWPMKKRNKTEHDDAKCWAMADALSCVATYLRRTGALPPLSKVNL